MPQTKDTTWSRGPHKLNPKYNSNYTRHNTKSAYRKCIVYIARAYDIDTKFLINKNTLYASKLAE